jgi:predicted phosphodiesterase
MKNIRLRQWITIGFGVAIHLTGLEVSALSAQPTAVTPANYKIAFIGDQGLGSNARAVLSLILSENADAVLHLGDFDYVDNPAAWDTQINDILGPNFPYFACAGNHDQSRFYGSGGYQEFMEARMNRLGVTWDGDLGVQSSLTYNGIFFVLTAPGVFGSGHSDYIRDQLAGDHSIWSISGWHKNMRAMQVGGKTDETGWGVYEESRKGGAIIATGHEHSYSRTHLLSSCQFQTVASTSSPLILTKDLPGTGGDEGQTFAFVNGLAGHSIRTQQLSGAWWASIYTSDQGANYGVLFGTFNANGDPKLATFYFKDIDGVVVDSFSVISAVEDVTVAVNPDDAVLPTGVSLSQNYPNPFNPQTEIQFQLSEPTRVELTVFNALGQEVCTLVDAQYDAGSHSVRWNGKDASQRSVASGVYLYRLNAGNTTQMKKMILLR